MKNNAKNRPEGISKGYRLRTETHRLVARVQEKIEGTKDDVISRACEMYYNSLISPKENTSKESETKRIRNNKK